MQYPIRPFRNFLDKKKKNEKKKCELLNAVANQYSVVPR